MGHMDPASGERGRHGLKVYKRIGRGAFGSVFKGLYDGQQCAIKVPHSDDDFSLALKRMTQEASILAKCNHNRIIGYKALCRLNPQTSPRLAPLVLVLEYASGGTLSDKVSAQMISPSSRVYSTAQALSWALDLASALEYLHTLSPMILHRDVKLSNVVLTNECGQLVAKLSDLGLHMVVDKQTARGSRTSSIGSISIGAGSESTGTLSRQASSAAEKIGYDAGSTCSGSSSSPMASRATAGGISDSANQQDTDGRIAVITAAAAAAVVSPAATPSEEVSISQSKKQPPKRRVSFIDAKPPGSSAGETAAPAGSLQHTSAHTNDGPAAAAATGMQVSPVVAAFAAAGINSRSDCYAGQLLDQAVGFHRKGSGVAESVNSLATDASCAFTTAGSLYGGLKGSFTAEAVFDLTGKTGSCMTMAPEVFLGKPYNDKADVFSFGVVLFELVSRCLLMFTELPTTCSDPAAATEAYAARVAKGYRPAKPKALAEPIWALVQACWQQEPSARPNMTQVVEELRCLLAAELASARPSAVARRRSLGLAKEHAAEISAGTHSGAAADRIRGETSTTRKGACICTIC